MRSVEHACHRIGRRVNCATCPAATVYPAQRFEITGLKRRRIAGSDGLAVSRRGYRRSEGPKLKIELFHLLARLVRAFAFQRMVASQSQTKYRPVPFIGHARNAWPLCFQCRQWNARRG
jgi:hypothetical protein